MQLARYPSVVALLALSFAALSLGLTASAQSFVTGPQTPCPYPVGVGDVDGDGKDDFTGIVAGFARVYSGGSGVPIPWLTRPAGTLERYTRATDVDSDGHDDVVWRTTAGVAIVVSGFDGSTLHTWTSSVPFAVYVESVGGADFDSDGFGDVILLAGPQVDVRSGRNGAILHTFTGFSLPTFVAYFVGDTDGDGFQDFTVAVPSFGQFRIVRGPTFATTMRPGGPLSIGDVSGNGTIDLVVRNTNTNVTEVEDGAGFPLGTISYDTSSTLTRIQPLGDVDGDGFADLYASQSVPTFLAEFVSGATLTALPGSNLALNAIGDTDGDGRVECWRPISGSQFLVEWNDPALPIASRMTRRGAAGTTSLGNKLRLEHRGSAGLGRSVFFDTRGTSQNDLVLLLVGFPVDVDLTSLGAPGNRLYVNFFDASLALATGPAVGRAFVMPTSAAFLGTSVSVQSALLDPTANALQFVMSNAVDLATNN